MRAALRGSFAISARIVSRLSASPLAAAPRRSFSRSRACLYDLASVFSSTRRRFLSFPFLREATWIAADETQPGYADRYAPLPTALQLVWLRRNPEWRLVFEQDGILVFRRVT